jgi:tRNA G18 (ribose-2'-O)-methylase SpoU
VNSSAGGSLPGPIFNREAGRDSHLHLEVIIMRDDFVQLRHQPPVELQRPRELIIACPPMRSNVNLSRIVRAASCCGVRRLICCGNAKIDAEITREIGDAIQIEVRRTLPAVLERLREDGHRLIGLEQTSGSHCIFDFSFPRKMVLVIGNERLGIEDEVLRLLHETVEIPVYGLPASHNVATAASMALYEYCRQYPKG